MKNQLSETTLIPIISRALQADQITLLDWDIQSAHGGYSHDLTGGIYRLTGTAQRGNGRSPFSLILKIVQAPANPTPEDHPHYWKRELLAYQSGLLNNLAPHLHAPHCFAAQEINNTTYWLWLEDVQDELGDEWPLTHFQIASRHLGQFNGRYLPPNTHPTHPWLSHNWLATWLQDYTHLPHLLADDTTWQHPLVHNILPRSCQNRLLHLWHNRHQLFQALAQLPQTFCHMDAFRPNLFAQQNKTILIDWDKTGFGAIGEELGGMVAASLIWFRVDAAEAQTFGNLAFQGYLQGLRDTGWQGDPQEVRLGFTAASALRWGIPGVFWLRGITDAEYPSQWVQWWQRPIPQMQHQWVQVTNYLLDLADEAFQLL
ncbi:MAG: hypothetical protein H6658_02325 [Ardenticatenaceae bacterium]|nr:hypothetical protein [Ardenticatenaceae bacterium]